MTKFHNFSQLARSDGNRLNRFVGFFLGRSDFGTIRAHNLCGSSQFAPNQCMAMFRV